MGVPLIQSRLREPKHSDERCWSYQHHMSSWISNNCCCHQVLIFTHMALDSIIYHQWCALPVRAAHAIHPPYTLPKYMYLDLPHHVLRNIARIRLRVHTLRVWTGCLMKNMCRPVVSIPRSALFVRSMPHLLSTTSLFYASTSPTGCPV
eukprot:1136316-Pelagomonas_calceolata.AAC.5